MIKPISYFITIIVFVVVKSLFACELCQNYCFKWYVDCIDTHVYARGFDINQCDARGNVGQFDVTVTLIEDTVCVTFTENSFRFFHSASHYFLYVDLFSIFLLFCLFVRKPEKSNFKPGFLSADHSLFIRFYERFTPCSLFLCCLEHVISAHLEDVVIKSVKQTMYHDQ